jgi:hypothetical protein
MKNLLFITAFLFVSILKLGAFNEPKSTLLVILENEKSVILNLSASVAETELFTITDANGDILISETVKSYDNMVKYDLSKLPLGSYTIKIDGKNFVEIHETTITKNNVSLENSSSHFKPNLRVINNRMVIDAMLANHEEIRLTIYNEAGDLVYDYNDQKAGVFQKRFNLEQLDGGKYNVIVSTDYFRMSSNITL